MKYSLHVLGISLAVVNLSADPKINDPLGHWIEKIHDTDPKVRGTAVVELGKLGANAKLAVPAIAHRIPHYCLEAIEKIGLKRAKSK